MRLALFALMCGVVSATSALAHYHMLLPDRHSVKAGDKVTVSFRTANGKNMAMSIDVQTKPAA